MTARLILASGSVSRQSLLRSAGVCFEARPVALDEEKVRASLEKQGIEPREVANELAKRKASAAAEVESDAIVLGCDQVLEFNGDILAKPKNMQHARRQLDLMNGQSHRLHSAVALYHQGQHVWSFIGDAELHMRQSSSEFLDAYVNRNWPDIGDAVGCYRIEEEGIRLFSHIEGDYFAIIGLPLLEVLAYLANKELIPT